MSKYFKKSRLLMVIVCVAMMLCVSVGVSAAEDNPVSYPIGSGTSEAINVTVTVEGLTVPYTEIPVSLPAKTSGTQKVIDALVKADANSSAIGFYTSATSDGVTTYSPITSATTYFTHLGYTDAYGTIYDAGTGTGYSGVVFRINGGFPVDAYGWGTTIATTVIENDDVISVYIDDPISADASTRFTRVNVGVVGNTVTATVTASYQYYTGSDWTWNPVAFAVFGGKEVTIYNATTNLEVATVTAGDDGKAVFENVPAGSYYAKVDGAMGAAPRYTTCTRAFTVTAAE